jgi:G3E family GTPase
MEETFEKSVTEIVNETAPESIVIEVAEAKEVESMVRLIEKELSEVFLANVVHIVDASVGLFGSAGDSGARGALERADFVLINKVDLVSLDRVDRVKAQVQEYNEDAVLVQTEQCEIGTDLFGSMVKRRAVPIFHSRDVDFQSFTYMSDRLFEWEKFQQTLADLPFAVYRAKGSVRCAQGGYRFDYVVGRPELERCSAGKTRMVFIGPQLNECRQAILRRVRACEV